MSKYAAWKSFEQSLTRKMKELGFNAKRNWSNQFLTKDGADIIADPFVMQLKYGKQPNALAALKEATSACTSKGFTQLPVSVVRYSAGGGTYVMMDWKTFETIIKKPL